jgi:hypothetical protein
MAEPRVGELQRLLVLRSAPVNADRVLLHAHVHVQSAPTPNNQQATSPGLLASYRRMCPGCRMPRKQGGWHAGAPPGPLALLSLPPSPPPPPPVINQPPSPRPPAPPFVGSKEQAPKLPAARSSELLQGGGSCRAPGAPPCCTRFFGGEVVRL